MAEPPRRKSMAGPLLLSFDKSKRASSVIPKDDLFEVDDPKSKKSKLIVDGRINITNIITQDKDLLCCKYNEDCRLLALGCTEGSIKIYNSDTGEFMMTLYDCEIEQSNTPVTAIKHRPVSKNYPINNCFICTYSNGLIKCWNYHFNQCLYTIRENRQTFGITYHPRLPKFVTYGDDCKINLYDEETKVQERILSRSDKPNTHDGHTSRVFAACFNPRSNHELLTGGWDNVVQYWDLRQPFAVKHLSGVHMCGEGIDINSRGNEVLTCAFQSENPIQLWDYSSAKRSLVIEPDAHNSKLYTGRFSGEFIITGGTAPNIFRVIDMTTGLTKSSINGLPTGIYCMDFGAIKSQKKEAGAPGKQKADYTSLPKVAFTSGKKAFQIEFY